MLSPMDARRPGRPRVPDEERKDETVKFRVGQHSLRLLHRLSGRRRESCSEVLRQGLEALRREMETGT